jgi:hypothetical protein
LSPQYPSVCIYLPLADEVPNYNVRKTCKLDTQAYSAQSIAACLAGEQNARATLVSQ